ncbi:MAG: hypothetical protein QFE16_03360 [Pseudomonadota bacterium]|nr:hypothetical protein [Pseudomonadota bacterium]
MKLTYARSAVALSLAVIGLSGCGGGSGSGSSNSGGGTTTYPASGAYGWVLKASGPTDAPNKKGLSLVHPSKTDTEYIIESASLNVTDARLLSSGSVDTGALRASSVQPYSLVYIVGGDVRAVSMQANGAKPLPKRQPTGTSSACRFLISANDYAIPLNSRYIISTTGVDGECNTSDDARAEVRLSSDGTPTVTVLTGDAPLDAVRDPATLAPRGWIYPRNVVLWNTSPATTVEVRASAVAAISSVVASTYKQALVEDGTRLGVINFSGGSTFTETPLDAVTTAGSGWQSIGYDADSFYVYRNSDNTFDATSTVLRITRTNPVATVVTSGSGSIALASLGSNVIYLTVLRQADNRLIRVNKTGGTPTETVTAKTIFTSVQTSASGVHLLWRVTNVGTAAAAYTIELVNESSSTPLLTRTGGWPINMADASTQNFNSSESRNRFIFASGFTAAQTFTGASLETYDAATTTSRVLGALPSSADFGTDPSFALAIGGPSGAGVAFAARSSGGSIQQTGARVYSFDLGTANSLKATSKSE